MTLGNLEGGGISSIFAAYKPCFVWDPYNPIMALGDGYQGGGRVNMVVNDIDSSTTTEQFSIWDAGNERFQIVTPAANPTKVLGTIGDFSDGFVESWWSSPWATSKLGFAVIAPTLSGMLVQDSVPADIIVGGTMPNQTYVDTTEVDDTIIERSNSRSATYTRLFQVLVKSQNDAYLPTGGNVLIGNNASAGTRVTDANTWCRKLPGTRGWWAVMLTVPAGTGTRYLSLSFKSGTGRWYISAPTLYTVFSTFENIVRGPIPCYTGPTSYQRGQWNCYNANSNDFSLGPTGWIAMSIILPDRSVSNGHLNYAGVGDYGFCGLSTWTSSTYRIRITMSDTNNHLAVNFSNGVPTFAVLDFGDDWVDFEKIGMVVTWGISNGDSYVNLYVNGKKLDSVINAADWFPQTLPASAVYIGSDGAGGSAADCWIPRFAMGRKPMHRSHARILSLKMRDFARTGNIGDMS